MKLPSPTLRTSALDPVRAEILIYVSAWDLQPGDDVRGKVAGPRCRYSSTIEIAYPLTRGRKGYHVLIPEPSAWDPVSPFLYVGKVELIRGGRPIHSAPILHGLLQLAQTPAGWRLNGKPFELRSAELKSASEEELLRLREQGINTLIPRDIIPELWQRAADIGFLVQPPAGMDLPIDLRQHFLTIP